MRETKKKSFIMLIALIISILSGCSEPRTAPELIEPVQGSVSFRPVERRVIGTPDVVVGNVVPAEYAHSFKKVTTIKEFKVDIGDYVKTGDVLAVADLEKLQDELLEKQCEKQLYIKTYEAQKPLFSLNQRILELQRQELMDLHDYVSYEDMRVQIETEQENHEYEIALYEYMIDRYDREIADIEEQIANGSLIARKSGIVTYIKDTSKNNTVSINEAVVLIADYEDKYIEAPQFTQNNYRYKKYEYKVALIGGREVPIEEYEYTQKETTYAKATENYLNIRYKPLENVELNIGDTIPLIFIFRKNDDVLAVGIDSLETDDEGSYVYVKGENDTLEKRYFESGVSDDYYIEVVSGLEEGEEVYYSQESAAPVKYKEYTVSCGEYIQEEEAKNFKKAEIINTAYTAPCSGTVTEVYKESGSDVLKGEIVLEIDSHTGSAQLANYDKDIDHLNVDYLKATADIDREIYGYDFYLEREKKESKRELLLSQKEVALINKQVLDLEHEDSLRKLQKNKDKLSKNNDGNGKISVVALEDGIVSKNYVKKGNVIEMGGNNNLLFSCSRISKGIAAVSLSKDSKAYVPIGARIKVSVKGYDDYFWATVVSNAQTGKSYADTIDGKATVSKVVEENRKGYFFIKFDDDSFFDTHRPKDCKVIVETFKSDSMIVLPGNMVHTQKSKTKDKTDYFVWKIQNGKLVKQYVVTGRNFNIGNDTVVVVIMGVKAGDVIAS